MADVQHIETSIRKRNRATLRAFSVNRLDKIVFVQNPSQVSPIRFTLFDFRCATFNRLAQLFG